MMSNHFPGSMVGESTSVSYLGVHGLSCGSDIVFHELVSKGNWWITGPLITLSLARIGEYNHSQPCFRRTYFQMPATGLGEHERHGRSQ